MVGTFSMLVIKSLRFLELEFTVASRGHFQVR